MAEEKKTLENFVSKWDSCTESEEDARKYVESGKDPAAYEAHAKHVAKGLSLYEQLRQEIPDLPSIPEGISEEDRENLAGRAYDTHVRDLAKQAVEYTNANLERILNETDEDVLANSLINLKPYKEGDYDEKEKLHEQYIEVSFPLKLFQEGRRDEAEQLIVKQAKEAIKKMLEERGKESWLSVALSVLTPRVAGELYEKERKKAYDEFQKKLGGKPEMINYILKCVGADEEKKGNFYKMLYNYAKPHKKEE